MRICLRQRLCLRLLFRVEQSRAVIAKTPDFLALACSVLVPAGSIGHAEVLPDDAEVAISAVTAPELLSGSSLPTMRIESVARHSLKARSRGWR